LPITSIGISGEIVDQVHLALGGDGVEQAVAQPTRSRSMPAMRAASAPMIRRRTRYGGRIAEDEARGVVLVEQGVTVFRRELLFLSMRFGVLWQRPDRRSSQEIRAVRQPLDRIGLTQRAG
jgi:hypothetical protein